MIIISTEMLTKEITQRLNIENSCYLSSDGECWLFTDDKIFNKVSDEFQFDEETNDREYPIYPISVAEWLYGKCEDNHLFTMFMGKQYDWSDYNMDAASDIDVSECCNNQWDQVMINYVRNTVEESISYELEESLGEMMEHKFEMEYIKDAIKNVLDLEDK